MPKCSDFYSCPVVSLPQSWYIFRAHINPCEICGDKAILSLITLCSIINPICLASHITSTATKVLLCNIPITLVPFLIYYMLIIKILWFFITFSSADDVFVLLGSDAATLGIWFLTFKRQHNGLIFNSQLSKKNAFFSNAVFQNQEVWKMEVLLRL